MFAALSTLSTPAHAAAQVQLEPFSEADVEAVVAVEKTAYSHPWSCGNFVDALQSGYHAQRLTAGDTLIGYFIAMQVLDEVHLLNITVAPIYQRQGFARLMLQALSLWARAQAAQWLWLEVRAGNIPALRAYEGHGFRRVGLRKGYYPDGYGVREDALVMSVKL